MYKKISWIIVVVLTISLAGCGPAKKPKENVEEKKIVENIKKPPIPEAISQGEN